MGLGGYYQKKFMNKVKNYHKAPVWPKKMTQIDEKKG